MPDSTRSRSTFSISRLRNIILLCLVIGVAGYTALMFSLSGLLARRFGPEVHVDLTWRTQRGAQELARNADLGLAVDDRAIVEQSFGVYARSDDVVAIVAVNASDTVVAQYGKSPEPVAELFSGKSGALRERDSYLVSWAPAEIEGAAVGKVAIVVSKRRLHDANALLRQSSNATLFGGLVALLLGVVVVTLLTRAVALRDAQLSDYAKNLERKVEERTFELDERNRGMRLVLDNVAQGFITIDLEGVMAAERSAIVDLWFGSPSAGATLWEFLAERAPSYAQWVEVGMEQLRDGFLLPELVFDQLPKRFSCATATYSVSYTPIGPFDQCHKILVIMSDVTEQIARERSEQEQKELVGLFQRISVDRQSVEEFLTEAAGFVSSLRKETDPVAQKRLIHTLKGNCAMYGLESMAELAHRVETELADTQAELSDEQRTLLVDMWKQAMSRIGWLLGTTRRDIVEIEKGEFDALTQRVDAGAPASEISAALRAWTKQPISLRLERLARQATALARRLAKPELKTEISAGGVRLDPDGWSRYWSSMVHVIRNAVDHGIESAEDRLAAGKPESATLWLSAERKSGQLIVAVRDDGRGIDWERVKAKAAAQGLRHRDQADLVDALFSDGLSTRDVASETSGRGIGLSAVREEVQRLGGEVILESRAGRGTTFRFVFDEQTAVRRTASAPDSLSPSLMPSGGR